MKKILSIESVAMILALFLLGCEGKEGAIGPDGLTSIVNTTTEPAGSNCAEGGIKVESGIDLNANGQLDTDEVTSTSFICSGLAGQNGNSNLITVSTEAAGDNCVRGGVRVESGIDNDGDGILDADEITNTTYVCNGNDGSVSLTVVTNEAAGANCANGGIRIDSGIDLDDDGSLGQQEITVTRYVCNGADGGVDEEIRIMFPGGLDQFSTTSADGTFSSSNSLLDFDIANYNDLTSVTLRAELATSDENVECTAVLYDFENESIVLGSVITSSSSLFESVSSANFLENMPDGSSNLAIGIFSEQEGTRVYYRNAVLILRR